MERPLAARPWSLSEDRRQAFRETCGAANEEPLANVTSTASSRRPRSRSRTGTSPASLSAVAADAADRGVRLTARRKTLLKTSLASRDETAKPVVRKVHRTGSAEPEPLRGLCPATVDGTRPVIVEYEPDTDLRDT